MPFRKISAATVASVALLLGHDAAVAPAAAQNQGGGVGRPGAARNPDELAAITTQMAVRIFFEVCVQHVTDEPAMRTKLQGSGFQAAAPAVAAPFLRAGPGTAWLRADPAPVAIPLAVVTRSAGIRCEVSTPLAVPDAAAERFGQMIAALAGPRLVVRRERDEASAPGGGPGRQLAFRVGAAPIERGGFYFTMSARPPVAGGIALLMTAAPVAPD